MAKLQVNMISYTLKRTVDLTIIIPSVTIPESMGLGNVTPTHQHEPFPVLYLLHGYGNNHATWQGYSRVELFAEERQIAVVMLSAENKFYSDLGGEDNYFTFISKELPEYIENTFKVSTKPSDTYIAGLSMGGYGALLHGLSTPERFAAIGSFSGAVKNTFSDKAIQPMDLIEKHLKDGTKLPPLYIACGKQDFIYESNVEFEDFCTKNNIEHTTDFVDGYIHEWRFWDLEVERFMDWIKRTDFYANKKRSV